MFGITDTIMQNIKTNIKTLFSTNWTKEEIHRIKYLEIPNAYNRKLVKSELFSSGVTSHETIYREICNY